MKIYKKTFKDLKKLKKEIYCLERLKKYNCFPKILKEEKYSVTLEHCGKVIDSYTYIPNWKAQVEKIINILEKEKIFQNDMVTENFVHKNGKIYLIDFEKGSIEEAKYPLFNIIAKDLENAKNFSEMIEHASFRLKKELKNELGKRKPEIFKKKRY